MSYLFIDTERVWRGGQDQLFTLLRGLVTRGHPIHLICHPNTLLEERSRRLGVVVHPVAVRSEIGVISFWRLLSIMRRVSPRVVAFNTPRAILLGGLASQIAGVRARIIFRRVNFPLRRSPLTRLKYNWGIDFIVAISESIRHQLERGGVHPERIRLVYEGIDLSPYPRRPPEDYFRPGKQIVVGTVAFLSLEKGHYYLIEAAALIPNVHSFMRFVFVGEGDCREALEAQARDRGLESCIQFAGFQGSTAEYLKSFDLFVLPSLSEGLSSAILSAMAASLPVIATNVGGIPELVHHCENGLLVPPADPVALSQAILKLAADPEEASRMGQEGRRRVEEEFTLERKILQTEELCAEFFEDPPHVSRAAHA